MNDEDEKKYELTQESINHYGTTVYRIRPLRDFDDVKQGDTGGYIQKEENLSHAGNCWVYDDAIVKNDARIYRNGKVKCSALVEQKAKVPGGLVTDNAKIQGCAYVCGSSSVEGRSVVYGSSVIGGRAIVRGKSFIKGNSIVDDYAVIDNSMIYRSAKVYGHAEIKNSTLNDVVRAGGLTTVENVHLSGDVTIARDEVVSKYSPSVLKMGDIVLTLTDNHISCQGECVSYNDFYNGDNLPPFTKENYDFVYSLIEMHKK